MLTHNCLLSHLAHTEQTFQNKKILVAQIRLVNLNLFFVILKLEFLDLNL